MSSRSLRRHGRKLGVAVTAAALGLSGLALGATPAQAVPGFEFTRLAGLNRTLTAVDISQNTFDASESALIARDDLYPDALSGNYLAGAQEDPILLSGNESVPQATLDELERLGATSVTLLGGTDALSDSVADQLEAEGYTVGREAGIDRYETAAEIAQTQDAATIGEIDGARTAILATGENFPDALAGGPLSYAGNHPILLTPSAELGDDAAGALEALGIEHVLILGGTDAVSAAAETSVEAMGMTTDRLAGVNRHLTAVEIADFALTQGFTDEHVNVATGQNFPDALTGGPHGGEELTPILLADDVNSSAAAGYLEAHSDTLVDGHIFGGTDAVSQAVEDTLEAAAQGSVATGVTTRPELVSAAIVDTNTPGELGTDGTTVAFTFDEDVATAANGTAPDATLFHLYNTAGLVDSGDAVVSQSGAVVNVRFDLVVSDPTAAALTLATVDFNAVEDPGGAESPEGDAPLNSTTGGGSQNLAAGVTQGPDLVSVGSFTADGANTEVAFTFDEAATLAGAATDYALIPLDGSAPVPGTSVDGGDGTTTHVVQFAGTLVATNFSRGTVQAGTVNETTDNEADGVDTNVLQAADISNGGNTADADLVSVTLQEGPATGEDRALFTFDENVTGAPTAASFVLYTDDGSTVTGAAANIDPGNASRVLVTYAEDDINRVVGAQVLSGAVTSVDPAAATNEDDEVGVANTGTTPGQTAGRTAGPDLTAVSAEVRTDVFDNVEGAEATYTFDEAVSTPVPGEFFLYGANGEQFTTTTCTVPNQGTVTTADDTQILCEFDGPVGDIDRPADAVLGTVDAAAVSAVDAGPSNPEGAEFVS